MGTRVLEDGSEQYQTKGGVTITRSRRETSYADAIDSYIEKLDERRGAVFSSNYEYPGRYTRWDLGFIDPPVMLTARETSIEIQALNPRGRILLRAIAPALEALDALDRLEIVPGRIDAQIRSSSLAGRVTSASCLVVTDPSGDAAPSGTSMIFTRARASRRDANRRRGSRSLTR